MPPAVRPDPAGGVFETMLVSDGGVLEIDAHFDRLSRSVRVLYGRTVDEAVAEQVVAAARDVELARARLTVAPREDGGLDTGFAMRAVDRAVVLPGVGGAVELRTVVVPGGIGEHKWADRSLLEAAERRVGAGGVPLLVDGDDVLEVSRGNVFAVLGDELVTPPLDGRILPGIVRRRILDLASSVALTAVEEALPLRRLAAADEVFVSGSIRGIEPVKAIGGRATWGREGRATAALARVLQDFWLLSATGAR